MNVLFGSFVHPRRAALFLIVFTGLVGVGRITGNDLFVIAAMAQVGVFWPKSDWSTLKREWKVMQEEPKRG